MARTDTRDQAILAALRLFARDGYEATSVRDIAAAVGIKASSLYKHFASKQAILDAIVQRMNDQYAQFVQSQRIPGQRQGADVEEVAESGRQYAALPPGAIEQMGAALFAYWTEDEFACLFRRLLTIEQYRSGTWAALYQRYLGAGPVAYQSALFAQMMQVGFFREDDPDLLALEFFAPILTLMGQADAASDEAQRARLAETVQRHITRFGQRHTK